MDLIKCRVGDNIVTLDKVVEVATKNRVVKLFNVVKPSFIVANSEIENSDKFSRKEVI